MLNKILTRLCVVLLYSSILKFLIYQYFFLEGVNEWFYVESFEKNGKCQSLHL